jgi:hypothetical protein
LSRSTLQPVCRQVNIDANEHGQKKCFFERIKILL